jgi:hypothetical protein
VKIVNDKLQRERQAGGAERENIADAPARDIFDGRHHQKDRERKK